MALAASTAPVGYTQHRPEQTLLYQIVAEHLETFLDEARSAYSRGLPKYVERELRAYLACGIHARGFLRARCRVCGKDLIVAFSCKKRSVCPSCNARRMCGTAARLVDHVFPSVPVRQWVLSVPFELRLLLAKNHRALSAVGRIFVREVFHWQREQAALRGVARARGGAVCFPQRFGGSLNLNVRYHVAVPDGVFTEGGTHRVMDPTTFLARLAALVPPPRHPLVRFHGVFAPHSAWRKKVVPAARADSLRCAAGSPGAASAPPTEPAGEQPAATQGRDARGSGAAAQPTLGAKSPSRAEPAVAAELARFSFGRIDWAALLKRVYDVDALACPCGGRLRFIALILEREVAQSILQSLGLPDRPPPIARARSPDLGDPIPPDE